MTMTRRNFLKILGGAGGILLLKAGTERVLSESQEDSWQPAYQRLEEEGKLAGRVEEAKDLLKKCELCPRRCQVDRTSGLKGFCQTTNKAVVSSAHPHFGEELPLVGRHGSGTIFFSNCNLRCVFCQNWPIAHEGRGREIGDEELAIMMLQLQHRGCHNINVVTPTHVMPNIINATRIALKKGLRIPLCYNTSGYELPERIKLLDGIVDIYLPDLKFMDGVKAARYNMAAAADYPQLAQQSILEMYRQVGNLVSDRQGVAKRGLMIRHLVMPNQVAGSKEFVKWVASNLSTETYVNIMSQYRVEHKAFEFKEIARAITSDEFVEAIEWARAAGLTKLDKRSESQLEIHRRRMG